LQVVQGVLNSDSSSVLSAPGSASSWPGPDDPDPEPQATVARRHIRDESLFGVNAAG
jgi:hypothetical protein